MNNNKQAKIGLKTDTHTLSLSLFLSLSTHTKASEGSIKKSKKNRSLCHFFPEHALPPRSLLPYMCLRRCHQLNTVISFLFAQRSLPLWTLVQPSLTLYPAKVRSAPQPRLFRVFSSCTHLVALAFSTPARILGECSIIHSPPALFSFPYFSFFLLKWRLARAD